MLALSAIGRADVEPWRARLEAGDTDAAWTLFLARYHRLVGATIARCISEEEDARDVFAHVCERLADHNLARLRRFLESPAPRAKFSTWLVVVVRNLAIDWRRARDGRHRPTPPPGLSPIRERIYQNVLVERQSHAEAYERVCGGEQGALTFSEFVREIAATYRAVDSRRWSHLALLHGTMLDDPRPSESAIDRIERSEERARLAQAMAQLSEQERAAIQLFVVEDRAAAEVAERVGWPNAKAVYNRVHRALAAIRTHLAAHPRVRQPPG
jgi:RNA polymerase sigma factor (sigma-70 family)